MLFSLLDVRISASKSTSFNSCKGTVCSKLIGITEHVQFKTFLIVHVLCVQAFEGMQDNGMNPFYIEATADELQPVPGEILKVLYQPQQMIGL